MNINPITSYENQRPHSQVRFTSRMNQEIIEKLYNTTRKNSFFDCARLYVLLKRLDEFPKGYVYSSAKGFNNGGAIVKEPKTAFGKWINEYIIPIYTVDRRLEILYQSANGKSEDTLVAWQKRKKGSEIDFLEGVLVDNGKRNNIEIVEGSIPKLSAKEYNDRIEKLIPSIKEFKEFAN